VVKEKKIEKLNKIKPTGEMFKIKRKFNGLKKKLNEQEKIISKLDKIKSEFIAVTSHQLRTPISSIRWSLEILLSEDFGKINKRQKNFLVQAYESNLRLLNILENLLRVVEIEKGKVILHKERVNFGAFLKEILTKVNDQLKLKEVTASIINKNQKDLNVSIDKDKIEKAIFNIINNAVKYNYVGGRIEIKIEQISKNKKEFIKCSIADTGVGIPQDKINVIFSRFFRADNVITIDTDGNGLSLYVTKSYIDSHGGKIWAESRLKKGSTFIFLLPI